MNYPTPHPPATHLHLARHQVGETLPLVAGRQEGGQGGVQEHWMQHPLSLLSGFHLFGNRCDGGLLAPHLIFFPPSYTLGRRVRGQKGKGNDGFSGLMQLNKPGFKNCRRQRVIGEW